MNLEVWVPEPDVQGELLVLPVRFVVAPDYGRFHPASLGRAGDGHLAAQRRERARVRSEKGHPVRRTPAQHRSSSLTSPRLRAWRPAAEPSIT